MWRKSSILPLGCCLACLVVSGSVARGQTTYHWLNTSGGSYHTAGNWTPAGGPPLFNDSAWFSISPTYNVTFSNNGTQTKDFQVRGGNVTFQYFGTTAQHFWGGSSTNYVGPQAGDAATSATLNLTNMFNNPMMGHHLIVGNTAGKTGTLNIHGNGWWKGYATSNVTVGTVGTGNLNVTTVGILQKSILEANNIILGQSGGTGAGTVSGLNASMTANNVLTVGEFANSLGTLTISAQGKVNVGKSLYVGVNSTKDNIVTVTGAGSELALGDDVMRIGLGGKGRLGVLDGGKVSNTSSLMEVGSTNGSQGILAVSGNGSHFNSTGSQILSVGASGQGDLEITSGGKVDIHRIRLGTNAGGLGKLVMSGNGTTLNLNGSGENFIGEQGIGQATVGSGAQVNAVGSITVGSKSASSLSIQSGGKVFSQSGSIGSSEGGDGSLATVTGNGSLWSVTGSMDVGWTQHANLSVISGGNLVSNGGRLGILSGSHGVAFISGAGSHWNNDNTATFIVGQAGQGTLDILSGGTVTSKGVTLATNSLGTGIAKISGANSTWNVDGIMAVGGGGHGTLTVENGGKLVASLSSDLRIGDSATGVGYLKVTGAGSEVQLGSFGPFGPALDVGNFGNGTLEIANGGFVSAGEGRIGGAAGSMGAAIVKNANSQWHLSDNLNVGSSGTGSLAIQNGAAVSAFNLFIGRHFQATGEVTLSGSNSKLTAFGNAHIGGQAGTDGGVGTLTINSGTTADISNQLSLWSQGEVNLNGGKLVLASLNSQGGKFNWNSGTVEFRSNTVLNDSLLNTLVGTSHTLANFQTLTTSATGGLVVAPGHFTVAGGKVTGNNFTNIGTTAIAGGSMQMNGNFLNDIQGTFLVEGTGQASFQGAAQNNGTFILAGAAAKSSGGTFTNNGTVTGRGWLNHQLINNGVLAVDAGNVLTVSGATNHGHVQLAGGRMNVTGQLANDPGGFITGHGVLATSTSAPGGVGLFNNGVIAVSGNSFDVHGDVRNTSSGRIITSGNATSTFWDDVEHNGAEIRTALGSSTVFYGSVTGAGPYTGAGSVFFEGDLKPGNSPANVQFEGDLHFGNTALLSMEIGGLFAGSDYDRLTVFGDVYLGGQLSIDLLFDFKPKYGDTFLLIDNRGANSIFGQFTGLAHGSVLTTMGHQFLVDYQAGSSGRGFALTAVPEPSSAAVLALAMMTVGLRRRRR